MWKAYRQIPTAEHQQRFMIIKIFVIVRKIWRYALRKVLVFGLAGAVLLFNRVPVFFTAFLRRVLAIPAQHFFDDFRIVEPMITKESGFVFFKRTA